MGRDFIMHHGVKGQHKGNRRWQNPDGSYTDAGFVHYYGHPRIRNTKATRDEFGKNDPQCKQAYADRQAAFDEANRLDAEYKKQNGNVFQKLATQVGESMKKSMEFRKDPENQKKYGQGIIPGLVNLYKDSKQKKASEAEAKRQADEAAENARKAEQTAKDFVNTYRDRDDATREDAYRAFLTAFDSDDNPVANALLTELHKTDKKSYKALTDENSAKKNELAKRRIDTSVEIFKDLGWYDDEMKRIQIEDPDEFEYQAAEVMWNSKEFALSKTGKQKVKELKRIYEEMGK